jgi:hypothetical protein
MAEPGYWVGGVKIKNKKLKNYYRLEHMLTQGKDSSLLCVYVAWGARTLWLV